LSENVSISRGRLSDVALNGIEYQPVSDAGVTLPTFNASGQSVVAETSVKPAGGRTSAWAVVMSSARMYPGTLFTTETLARRNANCLSVMFFAREKTKANSVIAVLDPAGPRMRLDGSIHCLPAPPDVQLLAMLLDKHSHSTPPPGNSSGIRHASKLVRRVIVSVGVGVVIINMLPYPESRVTVA